MWRRRRLLLPVACLALLAVAWISRDRILSGMFGFLVVSDRLERADLIFVLNGDPTVRPGMAARLYRSALAPRVAIARAEDSVSVLAGAYPNVTDSNLTMLRSLGVPDAAIVQLRSRSGATSTVDEARVLHAYVREHAIAKVIAVTSELHSRRARYILRRVLEPAGVSVMIAPVADRKYGRRNWWTMEDGLIGCQNEYLKLAFYVAKY